MTEFRIVKNLPYTIKNWVIRNQLIQNGRLNLEVDFESDKYADNFCWDISDEMYNYWSHLYDDITYIELNYDEFS